MKKVWFVVQSGPMQGHTLWVTEEVTFIGRSSDNDWVLSGYERVSRRHAHLDWDGESLLIGDLDSTNGIQVNEREVQRAVLKNGDRLDLGDFTAYVFIQDPTQISPPQPRKRERKWPALPGTAVQKWGAGLGLAIILTLGAAGMRRSRVSDPFTNGPQANAPVGIIPDTGGPGAANSDPSTLPPPSTQFLQPQEPVSGRISPEAVRDAKAATVLIGHRTPSGYAMGSGFALSDPRRIITNRHVVVDASGYPQDCVLIFDSGTARERKVNVPASSITLAPSSGPGNEFQEDLAAIFLDVAQTPALPAGTSENLRETDEVYALGFPLGTGTLTLNGDLPSASVKPARVERLQTNSSGYVNVIQLGSSVTHGNSGGPVVNNRGEVIGVISSGVEGTTMSYAIPMTFVRSLP